MISVIVPIYNVEKYLSRCIDSILNQSFTDLEIILVDDGSTDNCGKICDKYKLIDDRIKVIHKKNGGLSDARNAGITVAKGKYLMFVDSDDFIDNDMCKILLDKMEKYKVDIVSCNFFFNYSNGIRKINNQSIKTLTVLNNLETVKAYFCNYSVDLNVVWNKLYKKELFTKYNIIFPKDYIHEDNFIIYKLYYYAKKICIINDILYFYEQRDNSIVGKIFSQNILSQIECIKDHCVFAKEHDDIKKYLNIGVRSLYLNCINIIIKNKELRYLKINIKDIEKNIFSKNIFGKNVIFFSLKNLMTYLLIRTNCIFQVKKIQYIFISIIKSLR